MARSLVVALRMVVLAIPSGAREKALLEKDLCRIGCYGPWGVKMESMVAELLMEEDNWWEGTMRKEPDRWTFEAW